MSPVECTEQAIRLAVTATRFRIAADDARTHGGDADQLLAAADTYSAQIEQLLTESVAIPHGRRPSHQRGSTTR